MSIIAHTDSHLVRSKNRKCKQRQR